MTANQATVPYAMQKYLDLPFEAAVETVTAALKTQGFGVLTHIDIKSTLKTKLAVDVEPQVILGACNPGLAHQALQAEPDLGLLLPCNVVVRAVEGRVLVSAVDPAIMLGLVSNPDLEDIAAQARSKLQAAIDGL